MQPSSRRESRCGFESRHGHYSTIKKMTMKIIDIIAMLVVAVQRKSEHDLNEIKLKLKNWKQQLFELFIFTGVFIMLLTYLWIFAIASGKV